MNEKEAIEFLKEKGFKIEEPKNRFLKVKHSEEKDVLLKDEKGHSLIATWSSEENFCPTCQEEHELDLQAKKIFKEILK